MNNQNNMFSNMLQPSAIPEVKGDNTTNQNTVIPNQTTNLGTFNSFIPSSPPQTPPQSSEISSTNSFIPTTVPLANSNTEITPQTQNNIEQPSAQSLDFNIPSSTPSNIQTEINNFIPSSTPELQSSPQISPVPSSPPSQPLDFNISSGITNNIPTEINSFTSSNIPNKGQPQTIEQNTPNLDFNIPNNTTPAFANDFVNTPNIDFNMPTNNTNTTQQENNQVTNNTLSSENNQVTSDNVVSVGKYLGNMLLFMIPGIGFILLIIKAINNKDKNITNYARAQLILSAIFIVISIILILVLMGTGVILT